MMRIFHLGLNIINATMGESNSLIETDTCRHVIGFSDIFCGLDGDIFLQLAKEIFESCSEERHSTDIAFLVCTSYYTICPLL